MPTAARWFIKTALLYLTAGLLVGLVRTAQAAGLLPGTASVLWLPQLHLLVMGWITQLIFGVAFWLFPRPGDPDGRRSWLLWTAYGTLNLGLLLRLGVEPGWAASTVRTWGLGLSAGLQWIASLLLVLHFWPRVREK